MKGLSNEIASALDTLIEGLAYNFLGEQKLEDIEPERMKSIAKSKISSLSGAKKIITSWLDSQNRPNDKTIESYIKKILKATDSSLAMLRKALGLKIDFGSLDAHKHTAFLESKPFILETILDIENEAKELRDKIENNDLSFKEREFDLGFPEKFAKGEIIDRTRYYKNTINEVGAVIIDPLGTIGETIILDDLEIILPKQPDDKHILYSDLPKEEQYWRRPEEPNITPSNIDDFTDYITEEFRRRLEGIWFYNNGVATYMTGHNYFALTKCKMLDSGGYMDYRDAQKDLFYFMEACLVDNRCLGMLFGKGRRTGFTYCAICAKLNRATSTANTKHGLMSKSGTDGQEAFAKESYMFLNLPFWCRPVVRGKLDSPKELFFGSPTDNSKESKKSNKINNSDYLNTSMDWRNTKNGSYDSIKLDTYILDEIFKIEAPNDVITHLSMVAPTMMPNGRVKGKMLAGSTMGLHSKGGAQGVELIKNSDVKERNENTGKTTTGLYFYFLPSQKNMEEFTDKYGKCWAEKPEGLVLNVFGEPIKQGSETYLLAIEEQKRKQSDKAYNEQIRTYPRIVEHMMRDEATECVFNMEKLFEQIDHNIKTPQTQLYTTGNFDWASSIDGDVEFQPNPHGRFKVAWMPSVVDNTEALQNRVKEVNGKFYPLNGDVVRFGCDPYSYKSTHGKGSKGSIHGKTLPLASGGAPSNTWVVEYIARPPDETTFFEDVIKVIRFYGAPILVESNRLDLLRHMRNRGYRGFAMDRMDKTKLNENEKEYGGQMMAGKDMLDSHMSSIGSWVQDYTGIYRDEIKCLRDIGEIGEMPFNETLADWLKFNPDARTDFDATISSGLAIMACTPERYKGKEKIKKVVDISSILTTYSNKGSISKRNN